MADTHVIFGKEQRELSFAICAACQTKKCETCDEILSRLPRLRKEKAEQIGLITKQAAKAAGQRVVA